MNLENFRRAQFVLLGLVAILVLLPNTPLLQPIPFRDSGVFLYIGDRILQGDIPYRDVWDHKGPLIYYINALGLLIGNGSRWGVWILELAFLAGSAWIGFYLITKAFGLLAGVFGSIVWLMSFPVVAERGNLTEEFALLFQFSCFLFMWQAYKQENSISRPFLLGSAGAACFLLRPNLIGVFIAAVSVMCVDGILSGHWKKISVRLMLIGLGAFVVILPLTIYFAWHGVLRDLLDAVFGFNSVYITRDFKTLMRVWKFSIDEFYHSHVGLLSLASWLVGLAGITRRGFDKPLRALVATVLLALPLELFLISLAGRRHYHYFMAILPTAGILIAIFASHMMRYCRSETQILTKETPRVNGRLLVIALLLIIVFGQTLKVAPLIIKPQVDTYRESVADYVNSHVSDGSYVLIWGGEVGINFLTKRPTPTRFAYQIPLYTQGYVRTELIDEFLAELNNRRPELIIDASTSLSNGKVVPPLNKHERESFRLFSFSDMQKFYDWVEIHYTLQDSIDGAQSNWKVYYLTS